MTEADAREQAERIASAHDLSPANKRLLASSISNALLAASKPPKGNIIDDTGTVMKSPLPKTVDGVTVVPGMTLHFPSLVQAAVLAVWFDGTVDLQSHDEIGMPTNTWKMLRLDETQRAYSTSESAEAARREAR